MLLSLSYFWLVLRAMKLCFNLLLMAITVLIIHPQYPHRHAPIYQLHFITIPRSMHDRHRHPSSPSPFLSLAAIPIPHPHARNLVYLAAHHARVQLISTGTPKAARLHACVPCMQAAPSLIFFCCMHRVDKASAPHPAAPGAQPLTPPPHMTRVSSLRRSRRLHLQRSCPGSLEPPSFPSPPRCISSRRRQ